MNSEKEQFLSLGSLNQCESLHLCNGSGARLAVMVYEFLTIHPAPSPRSPISQVDATVSEFNLDAQHLQTVAEISWHCLAPK